MLSLYGREASKQTTLSILLRILIPDTRPDTKPENFTEILRNIVRMREQIVPGRFFLPRKKWPGNEAKCVPARVGSLRNTYGAKRFMCRHIKLYVQRII